MDCFSRNYFDFFFADELDFKKNPIFVQTYPSQADWKIDYEYVPC